MRCPTTSSSFPPAQRQAARRRAERWHASPGFPLDVVERRQARISPSFFIKEFDRTNSQVLSRYDGSVSSPDPNPTEQLAERS